MSEKKEPVIISLGGSIIVPNEINTKFLKNFKKFVLKFLKKDYKFVIVTGGGYTCRNYQKAASQISELTDEDKDWLGIHATRLNAHLLRTIFKKEACPVVLDNPKKPINKKHPLFIASGWIPGWSTDYDAVLLAKRFKAKKVINASNINHVYDKNKKPIEITSWKDYRKIISRHWKPGLNTPFDPVASKTAQENKMTVIIANGNNLENLSNIIEEKPFIGTVIHP